MTTTKESLAYPKEIIDEYLRLNLGSIFLRSLSPYGFATKTMKAIGYSSEEFVEFYKKALDYIIELNRRGHSFRGRICHVNSDQNPDTLSQQLCGLAVPRRRWVQCCGVQL